MLPTTNAPRPGNRFRSASNRSVMQKATDMVTSKLSWSTRNSAAYNSHKKYDSGNRGSGMVSIDTNYLSSSLPYTDNFPSASKTTWFKITKKANRQFLDKPWLLPTIMGTSFLSALIIFFFTFFSNSSQHGELAIPHGYVNGRGDSSDSYSNSYQNDENENQHHYSHRSMRKKHPRHKSTNNHHKYTSNTKNHHHTSKYNSKSRYSNNQNSNNNYNNHNQETHNENRFSMEKSVDHVFSLFRSNDANRWVAASSLAEKYCISNENIYLENSDAIDTLKGNIGTLIFDIVKFHPIYTDVTPQDVLVSSQGTFVSSNNKHSRHSRKSKTAKASHSELVSHLFSLADDLGILNHATKELHDFDTNSNEFWKTHNSDINHKTLNEDVSVLFDHADANEFYEISMELPKLVEKHCAHTKHWIHNQGEQAEENFYNSLSRAIFTVNGEDTQDISDHVVGFPVIDSNGDLMQLESGVLSFDKSDFEQQASLHYSRCELLDKIVFHGLTMSMNKHIDFMFDAAEKEDYYGFEVLADLLDTQYCNIINTKLSNDARNNLGLHLWTLMKDIINGEFHLTSDVDDESNEYVITTDGGIMHQKIAVKDMKLKKSKIIHCSMVKEIVKRGLKYHSGNHDYYHDDENSYDVDEFEHRYDDSGLSKEFRDEMKSAKKSSHSEKNKKQLKKDAEQIIKHLKDGEETEFVKLLDYLLDQYHSQWFKQIEKDSNSHGKRSVKLMIEQTLHSVILGKVNLSSQYDPENDLTILRKDVNELEIIHQDDMSDLDRDSLKNIEHLPLLDEVFKQIVNS